VSGGTRLSPKAVTKKHKKKGKHGKKAARR
jgi:hypothetical protein